MGSIPGSGRSPGGGYGNPLQYFCLENPMNGGTWLATVHEVAKSWTQLKQLLWPAAHIKTHTSLPSLKWSLSLCLARSYPFKYLTQNHSNHVNILSTWGFYSSQCLCHSFQSYLWQISSNKLSTITINNSLHLFRTHYGHLNPLKEILCWVSEILSSLPQLTYY